MMKSNGKLYNGRVKNSGQRALLQTTIYGDNGFDDRVQVLRRMPIVMEAALQIPLNNVCYGL